MAIRAGFSHVNIEVLALHADAVGHNAGDVPPRPALLRSCPDYSLVRRACAGLRDAEWNTKWMLCSTVACLLRHCGANHLVLARNLCVRHYPHAVPYGANFYGRLGQCRRIGRRET